MIEIWYSCPAVYQHTLHTRQESVLPEMMCSSAVESDVIDLCTFSEELQDEYKRGEMTVVIKWFDFQGQVT